MLVEWVFVEEYYALKEYRCRIRTVNKESEYLSCILSSSSEIKLPGESVKFTCYACSICDVEWMVFTAFE